MEDKTAKIIAAFIIFLLIICLIITRVSLGLSDPFYLITGVDLAAIIFVVAILLIRKRYNNRRRLLETRMVSESELSHVSQSQLLSEYSMLRKVAGVPTIFKHREIEHATDGFDSKNLLGKGASGSVFKGILDDGTPVAVKQIEGRGERQFRSEMAAIASVQHVNLVRLLGYCCVPMGPRFLVYDYIPNGSLEKWIFPRTEKEKTSSRGKIQNIGGCLDWHSRFQVAHDVAKALSYLHHDCRSKILHFDVKPENILLDQNYRAFVSDFGLSKLMGLDESRVVTRLRGTRGYFAPEWFSQQVISEKCDVYSYGIVLLEMVGGTRSIIRKAESINMSERKSQYFPRIVCERLREGRVMEVVDKRLREKGGVDEGEVKRLVCVGLWCIQEQAGMRPSMAQVVEMLEGRAVVEEPPENEMLMVKFLSGHDSSGINTSSVLQGDSGVHSSASSMQGDSGVHSSATCTIYFSCLSGR